MNYLVLSFVCGATRENVRLWLQINTFHIFSLPQKRLFFKKTLYFCKAYSPYMLQNRNKCALNNVLTVLTLHELFHSKLLWCAMAARNSNVTRNWTMFTHWDQKVHSVNIRTESYSVERFWASYHQAFDGNCLFTAFSEGRRESDRGKKGIDKDSGEAERG